MLKHAVGVNLNYEKGDPRVKEFFRAAKEMLTKVPQVKSYSHFMVENPQCGYQYGFILDFESKEALLQYFEHPDHLKFTEEFWNDGTSSYIDINFIPFDEN